MSENEDNIPLELDDLELDDGDFPEVENDTDEMEGAEDELSDLDIDEDGLPEDTIVEEPAANTNASGTRTQNKTNSKVRGQNKNAERSMLMDFISRPMSELNAQAADIRVRAAEAHRLLEERKRNETKEKKDQEEKDQEAQKALEALEAEENASAGKWLPISSMKTPEDLEKINSIFTEPCLSQLNDENDSITIKSTASQNHLSRTTRTLMGIAPSWHIMEKEDMVHGRNALDRIAVYTETIFPENPVERNEEIIANLHGFMDMHEETAHLQDVSFECGWSSRYRADNVKVLVTDKNTFVLAYNNPNNDNTHRYDENRFGIKSLFMAVEGGRDMMIERLHENHKMLTESEVIERVDKSILDIKTQPLETVINRALGIRGLHFTSGNSSEAVVENSELLLTGTSVPELGNIPLLPIRPVAANEENADNAIQTYSIQAVLMHLMESKKGHYSVNSKMTKSGYDISAEFVGGETLSLHVSQIKKSTNHLVGFFVEVSPATLHLCNGMEIGINPLSSMRDAEEYIVGLNYYFNPDACSPEDVDTLAANKSGLTSVLERRNIFTFPDFEIDIERAQDLINRAAPVPNENQNTVVMPHPASPAL